MNYNNSSSPGGIISEAAALILEGDNTVPMEENKMGVMPINKLLISMSLPMVVSMLVQALYNIVDSIFVAQLSRMH